MWHVGHHGPLTVDLMAAWARQAKAGRGDHATLARRLKMLRPFTRWMQQFEPATEVPDDTIFGRCPRPGTAHLQPRGDRSCWPPPGSSAPGWLRGLVYETLFGLIASWGLRISEALSLDRRRRPASPAC
jgi:hypothetical protein